MGCDLSFPKKKRLITNKQFRAVLARKLRVSDNLLILYMAENDCGYARLGLSISKSCGGAVVRNRLKRLLREVFRRNQEQIPAGFDYLLMMSPQWSNRNKDDIMPTFGQMRTSFLTLVGAAQERLKKSNK